ncbi:MAG: chromosome segregation protein SMC [Nanoarchaeota archaeon]|nr:chromosome segregation protein SMC [Nanoarchaeota archaeon]MBU1643619.1 chromosome segregation protein SMC [Nanoarchaeota archaeon]MBU1976821.1 chromosome segregation protein SMC [Nanoarchaeota archaeon]
MTIINRITIHGFKSFAHKTDIPFEEKFNCILGPNGSGKSNVGDALCFVLGRISAKSMRAEKAANLIFNGGKDKKPSSAGSVEIAFCNKSKIFPVEGAEVVVNRTLKKDGNSIYRINGKKKTRSEVIDLLSVAHINPNGYNIILQGDITRFVDLHPVERRKIIEEISDVSVYEDKKHKALLELTKVEEKLNNADIILKERKTYLKELKKDRDQALKFKELKDQIDSNKATFLHLQITEREEVKEKYDSESSGSQKKIDSFNEKVSKLKEDIVEHKKSVESINHQIEQKGEKEQLKVHREIEDLKVILAQDKTRISTLKDEINKINQRKDQINIEIKELEEKSSLHSKNDQEIRLNIQRKQKELESLEEAIAQFKKKNKIESSQELEVEIEEKDQLIEEKQEEVQQIRVKQQELLREKDRIEYKLESIDEQIRKVKEVKKENKEQINTLQQYKNDFKASTLRLNTCLDQDSSFASQLGNARRKLAELQELHAKSSAKNLTIKAGLASNLAVKSILDNRKKFGGVYGTIAELGQTKREYALALETCAGGKMQNIVVDEDKTAAECIKYLKSNKLGSASFIPLNKIKYQDISGDDQKMLKNKGVHDFALNLISFKSQYKKAFSYVFGKTLVVDTIDTARQIGIGKIKMATLDGSIAEASGVMKGGFITKKSSLGFQEKDSMEELEKLDKEIAEIQSVFANVEMKRDANMEEISSLRNKKAELEGEIIKLEKTLHLDTDDLDASGEVKKELKTRLKDVESELSNVQRDISRINQELANLKSKKNMLRSEVSQLRNPRLLAQLSAFEESRQKSREELLHLQNELKNITIQMEQMIGPEREKFKEIFKQHDKEEQQFLVEIKELEKKVKKKETELSEKEKESKEFYSKYKELFNQREKLSSEINKSENEVESLREKVRESEREVNLISLKNAEVKARLAGLYEEFNRYKDVEIFKDKNKEELQQAINKFEVMLAQMSAVNMKALEIYEVVEREFNKLMGKKTSLETEKVEIMTLMNEIESKKKEHFMKTFNQANENFQKIFGNLFKKGKAYLQLENPENIFEGGLSIKVKFTGNRFMDIKSLSGGEKTLTALSFIFAIQEYQPASFYVLDEIDAALDKHNSEILSKLIRNYADRAQYIIISHNDSLISEADTLFGVSMKDGVSKVTSLKL